MTMSQTTLIWRVKGLLGNVTNFQGTSSAVASGATTTVTVNDGTDWAEGDVLEWEDGDLAYVVSVATNDLTVIRSHLGTTGASHGANAVVYKNPPILIRDIKDGLDLTIRSLWPYVWKVTADSITPAAGQDWYDLAADAIDIVNATQIYGASNTKLGFYGSSGNLKPILMNYNLPTSLVASGVGVAFPHGFYGTNAVSINYRAKMTAAMSGSNYTEFDDGTHAECIAYGAAARLVQAQEGSKVLLEDNAQGEVNTKAGDRLQLWAMLNQKHIEYRNNWHDELVRTKPGAGVYR